MNIKNSTPLGAATPQPWQDEMIRVVTVEEGQGRRDTIQFPATPYLFLHTGVEITKPAYGIIASLDKAALVQPAVFEYKHSNGQGAKWWTAAAGIEIYFAFPVEKIEVVLECGYSYPEILIAGKSYKLNVSGGTSGQGWHDWVYNGSGMMVNLPVKDLEHLNANALTAEEACALGFDLAAQHMAPPMDDRSRSRWQELAGGAPAPQTVCRVLEAG